MFNNRYFSRWIFPVIVGLYFSGCSSTPAPEDGSGTFADTTLAFLRADYSELGLVAPPTTAFTGYENSSRYVFWDGGHLGVGNGYALNTSGEDYETIAIIRWIVELDVKSDDVMGHYVLGSGNPIIKISSAYRDPVHNSGIPNSSPNSLHMFGRAIDWDTDNTLIQGQQVYDAAVLTNSIELFNEPGERSYRPYSGDTSGPTNWIHSGW